MEFLFEALETLGVVGDRVHASLEDNLLGRRGTDHLTEPAQVGWAPGGAAGRADLVTPENGCEASLGRRELAPRLVTGSPQVADGFVLDLRDIDRRESTRAPQAGHLEGVTPVGLDPSARLLGEERGGHDPAEVALLGEVAGEPIATGTRFIDKDELLAFGLQLPDERIDIALARADRAEGDDLSVMCFGNVGHRDRLLMDIHADVERARLWHG